MRILIVEDESKAAAYAKKGLTEHGFVVDIAANGVDGRHLALSSDYDLVILDIMLPGADGWSVLREIREKKQTPVLFLTARDDVADRVKGLELGADDYLVKPFAVQELSARVRALLRRGFVPETLAFGDVALDPETGHATRAGRDLGLTRREAELLGLLLRNPRTVVTRVRALEEVWGGETEASPNSVDRYVAYLRRKLGDPPLIGTVRGVGFVLQEGG
jgi:DNA-binding response OmpR family regulator